MRLEFKRTGGGSDWRINNSGGLLLFGQSSDDLASVTDILRLGGGSVTPATDNAVVCGQSARRWTAVWAVNGTIQTSDATMKSNIQPLNSGLNIIGQLTPVSYQWNNTSTDSGKTHIGFLAQNLQQALPEVVYDHEWIQNPETGEREWAETRHLGINYSEIIPVLVRGIQEQQELISQLQLQNERLEKKITVPEQSK